VTNTAPHVRAVGFDEIRSLVGTEIGPTSWQDFRIEDVCRFEAMTHEVRRRSTRGSAETALGAAFALARAPHLGTSLLTFDGFAHGLNYGYDRVENVQELPVGSRFRMRQTLSSVERTGTGIHVVARQTFERESDGSTFCTADAVSRLFE